MTVIFDQVANDLDKITNYSQISQTPWYGEAEYDTFSEAEFSRRRSLLREMMTARGFDCLIVPGGQATWSQGGGLTWLTGLFDRRAMAQYVVFPCEGEPLAVYPMGGAHTELARRWATDTKVQAAKQGKFAEVMVEWIKTLGLERDRIGVLEVTANPGVEWPPEAQIQALYEGLPQAKIELISGWVHELRVRKSDDEVAAISRAGDLAVRALQALIERAQPGITEHQLMAAAARVILSAEGRPDFIRVGSTSGAAPTLTLANPLPASRTLQPGDMVLVEISAMLQGVTAQVGTVICVGELAPAVASFWDEVMRPGFQQLEATLQPGASLTEIQQAGQFFRAQNHQSAPLLLHGLDMEATTPRVYAQDPPEAETFEETLQPGMVVVLRPNPITADGRWGMCVSRTYVVTEQGQRCLTEYPLNLGFSKI